MPCPSTTSFNAICVSVVSRLIVAVLTPLAITRTPSRHRLLADSRPRPPAVSPNQSHQATSSTQQALASHAPPLQSRCARSRRNPHRPPRPPPQLHYPPSLFHTPSLLHPHS